MYFSKSLFAVVIIQSTFFGKSLKLDEESGLTFVNHFLYHRTFVLFKDSLPRAALNRHRNGCERCQGDEGRN